jgi:hypothetical protein
MSAAGISSIALSQTNPLPPITERRYEARQLAGALRAGDLAGAQQAYNALLALGPSTTSGPFRNPLLAHDFNVVGQALRAGDLAGAQQAFATLQQDIQNAKYHHHRRPEDPGPAVNGNAFPAIILNLSNSGGPSPAATPVASKVSATNSPLPPATSKVASTSSGSQPAITSSVGSAPLPPITSTVGGSTASAGNFAPEIIFNLGNAANSGPEIVFNLPNSGGGNSRPEIVFNLGNGSGPEQITVNVANGQAAASGIQINVLA